jgi:hypothetical protein
MKYKMIEFVRTEFGTGFIYRFKMTGDHKPFDMVHFDVGLHAIRGREETFICIKPHGEQYEKEDLENSVAEFMSNTAATKRFGG